MSVKGHLALLVGVFVVALAAVTLAQRGVVGELGAVVGDVADSDAPRARAARELWVSHLVERRALAGSCSPGARPTRPPSSRREATSSGGGPMVAALHTRPRDPVRLVGETSAAARRVGRLVRADTGLYAAKEGGRDRVVAGPAAGSRPFTPEGQDGARYR